MCQDLVVTSEEKISPISQLSTVHICKNPKHLHGEENLKRVLVIRKSKAGNLCLSFAAGETGGIREAKDRRRAQGVLYS